MAGLAWSDITWHSPPDHRAVNVSLIGYLIAE